MDVCTELVSNQSDYMSCMILHGISQTFIKVDILETFRHVNRTN